MLLNSLLMRKITYLLSVLLLVSACSSDQRQSDTAPKTNEQVKTDSGQEASSDDPTEEGIHQTEPLLEINEAEEAVADDATTVYFNDLSIRLYDFTVYWNYHNSEDKETNHADSLAHFDLDLGDWMHDKSFEILEDQYDNIELYVQEIVHQSMDSDEFREVSLCVMGTWKADTSDWVKIDLNQNDYRFDSHTEFPEHPISFTLDDYKQAVKEHCGESWFEEIQHIDSTDDLPASEFTSQYRYKFVARNSQTGRTIERIISFYTPTSC